MIATLPQVQQAISFPDLVNPRDLDAGSESDGWYTPPKLMDLVRSFFGGIDTDPATCAAAQAVVQAATWYTDTDDGMAHAWYGRLWLNPPYSGPSKWTDKALAHYKAGDVTEALILTNSYTETGWWQRLATDGAMLLFRGRMNFWHPEKTATQNRTGQTLCYLGSRRALFTQAFEHLGLIR